MANAHDLLMAQRAAMMGGKPLPYLRRVAYLESHGTEWIDTGVVSADDIGVRCEYAYRDVGGAALLFGCFGTDNRFGIGSSTLNLFHWWNTASNDLGARTINESIELNYKNSRKVFYGNQSFDIKTTLNSATRIAIFAGIRMDTGALIFNPMVGKIGDVKISRVTEDIKRLIAVLDLSGRPCYYDELPSEVPAEDPSRFFYNQGTGEFTWGELDAA